MKSSGNNLYSIVCVRELLGYDRRAPDITKIWLNKCDDCWTP